MLNEHSNVGIATAVFYVPAVILSAYLLFHRHRRPRMAWYFLFMFSLVRVASGVVVIVYENNPKSTGLLIATIILLGVGVMPLFAVTVGMLRIIRAKSFQQDAVIPKLIYLARAIFLTSVVLLVVGGIFVGQYQNPKDVSLGSKLVRAGYVVAVVLLTYLISLQLFILSRHRHLDSSSMTVLKGTLCAMVFLAVRLTYATLSVFDADDTKWNNLSGSVGIFVVMCLIMEYAAMICFLSVGLLIPRIQEERVQGSEVVPKRRIQSDSSHEEETVLQKLQRMWKERD